MHRAIQEVGELAVATAAFAESYACGPPIRCLENPAVEATIWSIRPRFLSFEFAHPLTLRQDLDMRRVRPPIWRPTNPVGRHRMGA